MKHTKRCKELHTSTVLWLWSQESSLSWEIARTCCRTATAESNCRTTSNLEKVYVAYSIASWNGLWPIQKLLQTASPAHKVWLAKPYSLQIQMHMRDHKHQHVARKLISNLPWQQYSGQTSFQKKNTCLMASNCSSSFIDIPWWQGLHQCQES